MFLLFEPAVTFDWDDVIAQGFAQSLLRRISPRSSVHSCGVTFDIVSNIPGVRQDSSVFWAFHFYWRDEEMFCHWHTGHAELRGQRDAGETGDQRWELRRSQWSCHREISEECVSCGERADAGPPQTGVYTSSSCVSCVLFYVSHVCETFVLSGGFSARASVRKRKNPQTCCQFTQCKQSKTENNISESVSNQTHMKHKHTHCVCMFQLSGGRKDLIDSHNSEEHRVRKPFILLNTNP